MKKMHSYFSTLLFAVVLSTATAAVTISAGIIEKITQTGTEEKEIISLQGTSTIKKSGKANKDCDPKKQPFRLYSTKLFLDDPDTKRFELCQRGCPGSFILDFETIVPGSTPSKSAEECCEKYPDASPEGFCFYNDEVCDNCEKTNRFSHYESLPPFRDYPHCIRESCGSSYVLYFYYVLGILPSTPEKYATSKKCCEENGCEVDDFGNEAIFDYCCDPKDEPFRLYEGDVINYYDDPYYNGDVSSYEVCARVCPYTMFGSASVVEGSKPSKSAEECCAKYPDQPDGFCINHDQACICEEQRFYHYNTNLPDGTLVKGCIRDCFTVELQFLERGMLPSSPKSYATVEECCSKNECEFEIDRCPPQISSAYNFDASEIEGMSFSMSFSSWFISKMRDFWIGEW